jgi:hypothetical protein
MSEMIKRVAEAMAAVDKMDDGRWEYLIPHARAAIEAMREPTHDMLVAGATAQAGYDHRFESDNAEEIFSDMIDAALSRT